jgi:hypothetical protein
MLSNLLPTFYTEVFNWYWFGALVFSVIVPAIAVVPTHAQQYRQHKSARLASDLFVREQMGFFSFSTALFVSAYFQTESKVLGIGIGILGALGALFFALGLWLTGPAHIREAFQKDGHTCSPDQTQPCEHSLGWRAKLQLVAVPFLLFLITFCASHWARIQCASNGQRQGRRQSGSSSPGSCVGTSRRRSLSERTTLHSRQPGQVGSRTPFG